MKRGTESLSRDPHALSAVEGKRSAPPSAADPARLPAPLKPHRTLFASLFVLFLVWVAVLLALYFRTVYPQRHPSAGSAATRPGASGLPSAPR
jgi:hypothetical protein